MWWHSSLKYNGKENNLYIYIYAYSPSISCNSGTTMIELTFCRIYLFLITILQNLEGRNDVVDGMMPLFLV